METLRRNPSTDAGVKKVLVVEDDPRILEIVSNTLHKKGYMVLEASDGKIGLQQVGQADIVLLDLFMPGIAGDEFMRKVRGAGNYVPIVVMSAILDKEDAVKNCESYGIVDFLAKPFKSNDLVEKIGNAAKVADQIKFVPKATERVRGFIERQARV